MIRLPVFCAACQAPLESKHDTNGDGDLVLFVRGCLHCTGLIRAIRGRVVARRTASTPRIAGPRENGALRGGALTPKPKRNEAGQLVCIICDAVLDWTPKPGRPPVYCETCRDPKHRPAAEERKSA